MNRQALIRTLWVLGSSVAAAVGQVEPGDLGMPLPAEWTRGEGRLPIGTGFAVTFTGRKSPRLERAADRLLERIERITGIPMRNAAEDLPGGATLQIRCDGPSAEIQNVGENESYELTMKSEGAMLQAPNELGVLRGLATFAQLIQLNGDDFGIDAVKINDRPRFPWRGLLIDVCRHWQPIDVIKRNLDGMAAVKLNVLHWHLSEDQGFRVESKRFPQLHEKGSDGLYFTQDQIREVIAHARDRGIRVVPEFDMPGHTTAWLVGHPELAAGSGPFEIVRHWGVFDGCFDPTREETYAFLDEFIGEMAKLFPDPYFHIGGDEVNGKLWDANPSIQAFMRSNDIEDNHDLQAYFNKRLMAILKKHGKRMVGWDEILHPDLPSDSVIQFWRGTEALAEAAKNGHLGILSNGYYLDHMQSASFHYAVDPLAAAGELSARERSRVLGGEGCMWGEYVSPETIDSRIWPRMAAIAERLWSPANVTNVDEMYDRLEDVSYHLDRIGLLHRVNRERMLRRLCGQNPVDALRVLCDVVEPVKLYERSAARKYAGTDPLNRLVDAARAESVVARHFSKAVDDIIARRDPSRPSWRKAESMLNLWRDNHATLLPIIKRSYLLTEVEPISALLADVAAIGLLAMDTLKSDAEWLGAERRAHIEKKLTEAAQPHAELLLMVVEPVKRLCEAASR